MIVEGTKKVISKTSKEEKESTKKKNFIRKVTQDFKILFKNYNLFFFAYYIYKIHFKILDLFKNKYK